MAEPIKDYILKHVFDAGGSTGKVYYYRITNRDRTQIVHNTTKELKAPGDILWADGCFPLAEEEDAGAVGMGVYRIIFFKELPGGVYNVTVHEQAGAGPVPTDNVVEHKQQKHGSIFGF